MDGNFEKAKIVLVVLISIWIGYNLSWTIIKGTHILYIKSQHKRLPNRDNSKTIPCNFSQIKRSNKWFFSLQVIYFGGRLAVGIQQKYRMYKQKNRSRS